MLSLYNDGQIEVLLQETESKNRKTGNTANLWVKSVDGDPQKACGDCPRLTDKTCYAWRGKPGMIVRKAKATTTLERKSAIAAIAGRIVRSAQIGDSGMVPAEAWADIVAQFGGAKIVGYTHQWKSAGHLRDTHMASVEGHAEAAQAAAEGWRYFAILPSDTKPWKGRNDRNEIACPSWASGGKVTCVQCRYCDGANGTGKAHVAIAAHGAGIKN